ncbi:MAG: TrmH family RNA methyltransferase [Fimbriimonas sp.]
MPMISWRERQRRMRAAQGDAWEEAGHIPADPGLRERYDSLPKAPIRLIACPLNKDVNQGGLLRLAEALRIERVDFSPEADGAIDMAGHRGTKGRQPWRWIDAGEAVDEAKAEGYQTVALTLSERAIHFERHEWRFPLAIVLGAEMEGVPPEIEAKCDAAVAIPLYGMVQSLNVAVAAAIVLQHAHSRLVAEHPEIEPARRVSRRLVGLPPVDYSS